jgi:acyl carrier protein
MFAEVLGVDPGTLSARSSPENVAGWDSLKSMEIVILLEEELGVEFSADEISELVSIGAMEDVLARKGVTMA